MSGITAGLRMRTSARGWQETRPATDICVIAHTASSLLTRVAMGVQVVRKDAIVDAVVAVVMEISVRVRWTPVTKRSDRRRACGIVGQYTARIATAVTSRHIKAANMAAWPRTWSGIPGGRLLSKAKIHGHKFLVKFLLYFLSIWALFSLPNNSSSKNICKSKVKIRKKLSWNDRAHFNDYHPTVPTLRTMVTSLHFLSSASSASAQLRNKDRKESLRGLNKMLIIKPSVINKAIINPKRSFWLINLATIRSM